MIVSPTVGGVIVAIVAFQIVTLPDVQSERGGSRFAAEDRKLDRLHPSCLFICFAKNADGFKPCSQLATRRPNLADQLQSVEPLETTLITVPVPGLFVCFFLLINSGTPGRVQLGVFTSMFKRRKGKYECIFMQTNSETSVCVCVCLRANKPDCCGTQLKPREAGGIYLIRERL